MAAYVLYLKTGQGVCLLVKYINNQMRHLLSFINIYVDFCHLLYSSFYYIITERNNIFSENETLTTTISWRVTRVLLQQKQVNRQSSSCGRFYVAVLTSDSASLVSRTLRACSQPFQGGLFPSWKERMFSSRLGHRTQFLSWSWVTVLRLELMPHIRQVIFERKFLVWNITF